ncbi:MAG: hypothetical protein HUK02_01590 [Bacteroidaceae bacterium]|nr:hypothetical protein [Bacteroidaceae bacterium]
MKQRRGVLLVLLVWTLGAWAQNNRLWRVEAESPQTTVTYGDDFIDMRAPRGLTLWYREPMTGDVCIEYEAMAVGDARVSDLNCFWKASDPKAPHDIVRRSRWRHGNFVRHYSLQLYYMSLGGNGNTTTRFRRYTANEAALTDEVQRPPILQEYTDAPHLLTPDRWYRIRIECCGNRVRFWADDELLVDYRDPQPLTSGWFGFRTTQSHTRLRHFRVAPLGLAAGEVPLHWIGDRAPALATPCTWGVPFARGEVKKAGEYTVPGVLTQARPLALWPDGSVKWAAYTAVLPAGTTPLLVRTKYKTASVGSKQSDLVVHCGSETTFWDSLTVEGRKVAGACRLVASTATQQGTVTQHRTFSSRVDSVRVERDGPVEQVIKICGTMEGWMPFVARAYYYKGSRWLRLVLSHIYDGDPARDCISSLGLQVEVPLVGELYNRHVAFGDTDGHVWAESVQPLVGRRALQPERQFAQVAGERIPPLTAMTERDRQLIADWATWDRYRLSQLNDMGYTLRKWTGTESAPVGTMGGHRASGFCHVGTTEQGLAGVLHDFWQSYPSTLEVTGATTDCATLTFWLWSPEAEPMDLRHYDTRAHGLNATYEDVQPGLSTPYGIARTSELTLMLTDGYHGKADMARLAQTMTARPQLACNPAYLHDRQAFGVWSLPHRDTPTERWVEDRMDSLLALYTAAVDTEHWYGYWHYGDVMHTTDPAREGWLYDVGGYAWDNTELGTNMWLWYAFLRTGRQDLWQMARAMTRHNSEVDVYHKGDLAGLGSRHNVSHWGCGAKEARISQALWNRFLYFLTADDRMSDLMDEVADADQRLYTLDPMRLAQPRELYPCTAPARLRIGPDWLSYAGNWFSRWERTGEMKYRRKIETGMACISQLHDGLFTGPLALGYYPDSGKITCEVDASVRNTNHLLPLMGGFEFVNELELTLPDTAWHRVWLDHNTRYKALAKQISKNSFRIPRLAAYAYYHTGDKALARSAWDDLLHEPWTEFSRLSTNDAARWCLDAIYMQEVCPAPER